ncbi:Copia protein, partial [Mucuna pruriens]
MHEPRKRNLQVVERILQYLKASLGKGLLFRKEGSIMDRRFTSGYCMFLGGNLVTGARSKMWLLDLVQKHNSEPWHKIILDDLKVNYEGLIKLFCDNNLAISIVYNPIQHDWKKHIEIDRNFTKEKLDSGLIVTAHMLARLQVADVFTKGLHATRFQELNGKLHEEDHGVTFDPLHVQSVEMGNKDGSGRSRMEMLGRGFGEVLGRLPKEGEGDCELVG